MNHYQELLDEIIVLLKAHPRGLELKEISELLGMNRNTVSKYLDVLLAQGQAQMKRYGPAKVFFLTSGIPVSSLIHYSSDCIFVLDRNLRIVNANESAKNHACTGNSYDDLIGKDFFQVVKIGKITVGDRQIPDLLDQALQGEFVDYPAVYVGKRFRNSIRYINFRLYPTVLEDGSPGVAMVIQNVTNEIENHERARQAEEKLTGILSSISDPISIINRDYTITYANKVLMNLLDNNLVGQKCYTAFYNRDSPCNPCIMTRVFNGNGVHQTKTTLLTSEGNKKSFAGTVSIAETTPEGIPHAMVTILRDSVHQ